MSKPFGMSVVKQSVSSPTTRVSMINTQVRYELHNVALTQTLTPCDDIDPISFPKAPRSCLSDKHLLQAST